MIGIAFDSATYWNDFRNNKISQNKSSKLEWNWGVALADVKGAIGGALWGSAVAGPVGRRSNGREHGNNRLFRSACY